jgi:hypothetical protein
LGYALSILKEYKLSLNEEKKDEGFVLKKCFDFLGVEIDASQKLSRPSKKNRKKLKGKINEILKNKANHDFPISLFQKMELINKKIIGWGNTFRYLCDDNESFKNLDKEIFGMVVRFLSESFFGNAFIKTFNINSENWEQARNRMGLKTCLNKFSIEFSPKNKVSKYVRVSSGYFFIKNKKISCIARDQQGKIFEEDVSFNGNSFQLKERILHLLSDESSWLSTLDKIIKDTDCFDKIIRGKEQKNKFRTILIKALKKL